MARNKLSSFTEAVLATLPAGLWNGCARFMFVCNRSGLPAGDGSTPDYPISSLFGTTGALVQAANSTYGGTSDGVMIIVLPGHAENITGSTNMSTLGAPANTTIVCLGSGTSIPTFSWTAAASSLLMNKSGTRIHGGQWTVHNTGADATITTAIVASASGCSITGARIFYGHATDNGRAAAIVVSLAAGADDFTFGGPKNSLYSNYVYSGVVGPTALTTDVFQIAAAVARPRILGNKFVGATSGVTKGLISVPAATAATDIEICDNYLHNTRTDSEACMSLATATLTGTICFNLCRNQTDTNLKWIQDGVAAGTAVTTNTIDCSLFQNYGVNNDGETGILIGTASA